jgi:hypothetical protein
LKVAARTWFPAKACDLGWQDSLRKLAKLVEPEINQ